MEAVDVEVLLVLPELLLALVLLDEVLLDEEPADDELEVLEDEEAVDVFDPRESVR